MGVSARVLEAGGGLGGTWYWNRYPGARCDVESMQYSYQFSDALQQEWAWTERYSGQPEILRYANHVADRFGLRDRIQLETRVKSAAFDEAMGRWHLETEAGERVSAAFCVMATGCLSAPNKPTFEGLERFEGASYHTATWPHEEVDFTGRRVAVIGTGSSAIQSIPIIARAAARLYVFQRTPNYAVPARNGPLDPAAVREIKAGYAELRRRAKEMPTGFLVKLNPALAVDAGAAEREREYETRWREGGLPFMAAFVDLLRDPAANQTAAEFVRGKIRATVRNQAVAEALCPRNFVGAKRLCVDTGYYQTYNRPNVTLIDLAGEPIEAITPRGVRTRGREWAVDDIVFATGFDAMTGALLAIDIRGRGGAALADKWRAGPRSYLGLAMAGFPNLFTITGPGSPSVFTNMLPSIEQHVDWIADCLGHMRARGLARIEPLPGAEDAWVAHVAEVGAASLRSQTDSWYLGANVAGKPRVFMPYIGGFPVYTRKCDDVAAKGYEGFALS